ARFVPGISRQRKRLAGVGAAGGLQGRDFFWEGWRLVVETERTNRGRAWLLGLFERKGGDNLVAQAGCGVRAACGDANGRNACVFQGGVDELIAEAALEARMGFVIELDGYKDPERSWVTEYEVNVLCADEIERGLPCAAARRGSGAKD